MEPGAALDRLLEEQADLAGLMGGLAHPAIVVPYAVPTPGMHAPPVIAGPSVVFPPPQPAVPGAAPARLRHAHAASCLPSTPLLNVQISRTHTDVYAHLHFHPYGQRCPSSQGHIEFQYPYRSCELSDPSRLVPGLMQT